MIRATDDEALAVELWGDDKKWDDDLKQFVPAPKIENDPEPAQPVDMPNPAVKATSGRDNTRPRR